MKERKVKIEGELTVDQNAIFSSFQKDLDDTKQLMKYVILVLLVMVATMIIMVADMAINAWNRNTDSHYFSIEKYQELDSKINLLNAKKN